MIASSLLENNVTFNSVCCEVRMTLADMEASQDSALKCISMAVRTRMLVCDVALHTRKSIMNRTGPSSCLYDGQLTLPPHEGEGQPCKCQKGP